jgi:hypothetical protein
MKIWQGACKDMQSVDMEENETISISNIDNKMLRRIPREHNFDLYHRTGGILQSTVRCPGLAGAPKSCRRNNLSFE